jgi:hypothetical protein
MFPNATPEMHLEACKILIEKLPVEPINYRSVLYRSLDRPPRLITVNDFRFVWLAQLDRIRDQIEALKLLDIHPNYGEYSHQYKIPRRSSHETKIKKHSRENEDKGIPPLLCTGCGRKGHAVATCFFRSSPYHNETATPFLKSAGGKKLLAVDPDAVYIPSERGQTFILFLLVELRCHNNGYTSRGKETKR